MTEAQANHEEGGAGQRRDFVRAFESMSREGEGARRVAPVLIPVVGGGGAVAFGAIVAKGGHGPRSKAIADVGRTSSLRASKSPAVAAGAAGRARSAKSPAVKPVGVSAAPVVVASTSVPRPVSAAPRAATAVSAASGSVEVTGQVSCVSGRSVEGVWVSVARGSGFASWLRLGNGSTSDYWYTLPVSESYSLHVGCGGSTSSWAGAVYGPTVAGTHSSFNCYDVSGQADYGTCVAR